MTVQGKSTGIGQLRHRVELQERTPGDDWAENPEQWTTVDTTWAQIRPMRSAELVHARSMGQQSSHVVIMRQRKTIDLQSIDRILHGQHIYHITGVRNAEMRDRYLLVDVRQSPQLAPPKLAPYDCLHVHTADAPAIMLQTPLAPLDALHALTSEAPAIIIQPQMMPVSTVHAHTSDAPAITIPTTLAPASTVHAHTSDAPSISVGAWLWNDDSILTWHNDEEVLPE